MSLIIFILVWAACAYGGYTIGKGKGRETQGLVLGLLLGVIGVIIIAVMPPKSA